MSQVRTVKKRALGYRKEAHLARIVSLREQTEVREGTGSNPGGVRWEVWRTETRPRLHLSAGWERLWARGYQVFVAQSHTLGSATPPELPILPMD